MTRVSRLTPSTPPTRLVLLGHPVAHSLSPLIQDAALARARLALRYEALDVPPAAVAETIALLVRQRGAGNVTIPHKEAVYALCTVRTPVADRVGAVNTFWVSDDGTLYGDNTDVPGFSFAVARLLGTAPQRLTVALLGAGGAAAAVCEAVSEWGGSRVRLWARTRDRADRLAARWAERASHTAGGDGGGDGAVTAVASVAEAMQGADLIVNATPLGLDGTEMPVAPEEIPETAAVMDLSYRREATPWITACRDRGLRADDGLPMLIEQGALSFERWFGVPADREAMWAAVR